jgi:hypothetical protein
MLAELTSAEDQILALSQQERAKDASTDALTDLLGLHGVRLQPACLYYLYAVPNWHNLLCYIVRLAAEALIEDINWTTGVGPSAVGQAPTPDSRSQTFQSGFEEIARPRPAMNPDGALPVDLEDLRGNLTLMVDKVVYAKEKPTYYW